MGYALRYVPNRCDAEDLAQEVMVKMLQDKAAHPERTYNKKWFFTTLSRCYFLEWRKKKRRIDAGFAPAGEEPLALLEGVADPYASMVALEMCEFIEHELSDGLRDTLLLIMGGASYEEVAQKLGVPFGTVLSRLHRARGHLKTHFELTPIN